MQLSVLFDMEKGSEELFMQPSQYVLSGNQAVETVRILARSGQKVAHPEKVCVVVDREVPPNSPEVSLAQRELMDFAKKYQIPFYYGRGMAFSLLQKEWQAESLVLSCDPDVFMVGGVGAIGLCLSPEEMARALTMETWKAEERQLFRVQVTGHLPDGADVRDAARAFISSWKGKMPQGAAVAFSDGNTGLSAEEWMILCGSMQKLSVGTAAKAASDWEGAYDAVLDLSQVQPSLDVGQGHVVDTLPAQSVQAVFIGGAYGGFLVDIKKTAEALEGRRVAPKVRLSVAPNTAAVYSEAARAGYLTTIMEAGGLVLNQCATPHEQAMIGKTELMISNDSHNEEGYAGDVGGRIYLASTETAIEAALSGRIGEEEKPAQKDMTLEGRVWKFGDDIDTDIIIPTQHLSYASWDEVKKHMFEPLRPELAAQIRQGDIIVAGSNFGCGSSREQAAEVIATSGIRCIIAKSFARIFFRNAINNGVLLIECPALPDQVAEGDTVKVVINEYILHHGKKYPIPKMPENLYRLIMDGGLVASVKKRHQR